MFRAAGLGAARRFAELLFCLLISTLRFWCEIPDFGATPGKAPAREPFDGLSRPQANSIRTRLASPFYAVPRRAGALTRGGRLEAGSTVSSPTSAVAVAAAKARPTFNCQDSPQTASRILHFSCILARLPRPGSRTASTWRGFNTRSPHALRRQWDAKAEQVADLTPAGTHAVLVTWHIDPQPVDAGVPEAIAAPVVKARTEAGEVWFRRAPGAGLARAKC